MATYAAAGRRSVSRRCRLAVTAAVVLAVLAGCGATTPPPTVVRTVSFVVGQRVWVNVAVATLWTSPSAPRAIDAPALRAPVNIRGWLAAMSTTARRGLVGRVETQALLGDRLLVTRVRTGGLHVVAVGQPTSRDRRGYPGWVPARQVTARAPVASTSVATLIRLTAWLRDSVGRRVVEVSYGTRMPVLALTATKVTVATPTHGRLYAARADVVVRSPSAAALARTAASVVRSARLFVGKPYIWGGRSGFAVDCSGFTELVYAVHGVVIPRDTGDQARAGRAASLAALRPGDLVFFRSGGSITHVGLVVGSGQMVHAPRTGVPVQIAWIGHPALARRFL